MGLTAEVAVAIEEIRSSFPDATVEAVDDGDGGALVFVDPVDPGPPYQQRETWVGFRVTFQYPCADVYPHFVRGDLARTDGGPLGEATSVTVFEGRHAVQLSRRSNHLDPETDTAAIKLHKVLTWLGSR